MNYKNKIISIIKDIGTVKAAFSNENTGSEDNQNIYDCLVDSIVSLTHAKKLLEENGLGSSDEDYGFHWDGSYVYDKDGNHWYFGDYIDGNTSVIPYSSYMQAVKETENGIRDSFTEDEISDPEGYAYQLVDFAVETLPDPSKFIKEEGNEISSSRKPIKSGRDKEIYRQAFGSLIEDNAPDGDFPGTYRVLVDGNYETEFSADSHEEAIQKFKDYFENKRKGITNSRKPIKSSHNGEDICGNCSKESDILVEDFKKALGREGYNMDTVNEFFDDKELDDYDSICYDCESKLRKEFEKWSINKYAAFSSRKPIKSSRDKEETEILERGYKGHQVQHDEGAWILDQEKRFWNLTDLKQYVDELYTDEEDDDWDDEISSSANRNTNNLNSIFNG